MFGKARRRFLDELVLPEGSRQALMDQEGPTFHEEIVFDANLQEFAGRVGFICGLEAGGRISQVEAYERIRELWHQLKMSRKNLRINEGESEAES